MARSACDPPRALYESVLDNHVLPRWRVVPLAHVEHGEVQAWVAQLVASGLSAGKSGPVVVGDTGIEPVLPAVRRHRVRAPVTDASNGTQRQVLGVPLLVSKSVTAGVIWGVAAERILVVLREDVSVDSDASVFSTSDRIAVRAVMRIGFAFPSPLSIAKISLTAAL